DLRHTRRVPGPGARRASGRRAAAHVLGEPRGRSSRHRAALRRESASGRTLVSRAVPGSPRSSADGPRYVVVGLGWLAAGIVVGAPSGQLAAADSAARARRVDGAAPHGRGGASALPTLARDARSSLARRGSPDALRRNLFPDPLLSRSRAAARLRRP